MSKYKQNRPDLSDYLVHFTKGGVSCSSKQDKHITDDIDKMSAYNRLLNILDTKTIIATPMPWVDVNAVCFTECPWNSLLAHAKNYSPYGIGFSKPFIYACGGNPVFYIRDSLFHKAQWPKGVKPFLTPFKPVYRPRTERKPGEKFLDYTHEREWRVPHMVSFEYDKIEFIILDKYEDMAKFPKKFKDAIGREKFILMENYRSIETIWPTHKIG